MIIAQQQKEKLQMRAVHVSIIISIILFLISFLAGVMSDSITLLLDASAGFIIVFMAFVLKASIKKVNMPPDHFFNFGYEKFEPFTVVIQGVMIILSCVIAAKFAIQDIVHAEDIVRYDIPVAASVLSGIISVAVALYLKKTSIKTHSTMLRVSSLHWFIDSLLSFAMCLGFGFGLYVTKSGYSNITPYVDPVMALILACVFLWTPFKAMKSALLDLLDAAPAKEVCSALETVVEKHKARAFGINSIRMRKAGEKVFVDVCFIIHGHTTMLQAQEFAENFKKDIATQFPKYDVVVYFYPAR